MAVTLRWEGVSYSIPRKRDSWWRIRRKAPEVRRILDDISGEVSSGDLVAIVGASGAGKTTLLAAISRRIRGNKLAGKFTINARDVGRDEMTRISGFVPQSDSLIDVLTIEEHLMFICQLKYSRKMGQFHRKVTIRKILTELGLHSLATSRIGTLSGGERKKLNLATELLGEPFFLFCDEPTTGLDSFNALMVIKTLKKLCGIGRESRDNGNFEMEIATSETELWEPRQESFPKGIVCSIHQPSSDIFHSFSQIILIREGRVVFQGSTAEAKDQFHEAGFTCPEDYNPIEYYVKIVAEQPDLNLIQQQCQMEDFSEGSEGSFRITADTLRTIWILQVFYLLRRSFIVTRRSFLEISIQSGIYLSTSIILALLYRNVNLNSQTAVQDIAGVFFTVCTEIIFGSLYSVIIAFSPQLPLIRRETGERLFSLSAFYAATVLMQIPRAFLESFIFLGVVYASVDFSGSFLTYILMSISLSLSSVASMAYGFMIAGVCVNENFVQEISVPFDTIMLILGGFYMNVINLPYVKYISLFYLTNEALSWQFWREIDTIGCSEGTTCLRNGTDVLDFYSFGTTPATIWRDYLGFGLWFIIAHLVGFLGLRSYVRKEGFY
uniref:Putative transporter abc superfamily breast cancer resistance protein n=1 Tax=Lutzomyia longipalpis TaxID=7200 RepID=A0A1B0CN52_LUTLO